MLSSWCRLAPIPSNLFLLIPFSLSSYPLAFLPFSLRCLHRNLGLACHSVYDSDLANFDELELELNCWPPPSKNPPLPIINRRSCLVREFGAGIFYARRYSFNRKWCNKEILMKRIALSLSKQGWDLNFLASFSFDLDSCYFARMLNDLFDESLDAALVYYMYRTWRRWDDRLEHKLQTDCTMVHIAVSGNMNHIAVNLLRVIVRSNDTVEDGQNLIFDALWHTRRKREELETVYSMLVICFGEEGKLDIATKLMTKMEMFGFYPSNGVYFSIGKLVKPEFSKKIESDMELFVEMQSWGAGLIELTLSLFIQEFCARGFLERACKLLYDMQTFGIEADIVAYTIVIDAFCKRGFLKEATSLLFKMAQMGLSPDLALITSIFHSYCKIGRLEAAVSLLDFCVCVPDAFMYNSFIFTWCQNGDVENAHALLNMMFDLGVTPDSINYTTVINGYCKLCQISHALKTFAQMLKKGIKPTIITYTFLVEAHFKNDDIQGAEFVLDALEKDGLQPDTALYNVLINGYSKKGLMHKAYDLMDLMKKAGVFPDSVTYNIIMHGLIKRGFAVESIFSELVRRGYSPDDNYSPDKFGSTNVIYGYSKEGRLEEAYLIWCSMSKRGMTPDVVTCSALLSGFCKMHRMQDVDTLFQKMLDVGLEPDLILYNTLIRGFCSVGDVSKACQLLVMMKTGGIFPNNITHDALAIGLEKNGVENARESATMIMQQIFAKKSATSCFK